MTSAGDPTYFQPNTGWTVQSNTGTGTGPCNSGVTAGALGWTSATVNGVKQSTAVDGASGPLSATYADPSGSGAVSEAYQKQLMFDIPPASSTSTSDV